MSAVAADSSNTLGVRIGQLPSEAVALYVDGSADCATVWAVPVGRGHVVVLGYDFYSASQDNWNSMLSAATQVCPGWVGADHNWATSDSRCTVAQSGRHCDARTFIGPGRGSVEACHSDCVASGYPSNFVTFGTGLYAGDCVCTTGDGQCSSSSPSHENAYNIYGCP